MKKTIKFLAGAAVAALTVVSCSQELELDNANKEQTPDENAITIRVHASADEIKGEEPELKTYIDNTNTIIWGTGEYMKLALTAGETTTFVNSTDASADIFNGDPEAMFEFSVTPEAASEYVYQGLYPASAAATSDNKNAANYKVNLPAIQNATASSYDPAAYIMVAKPETFTSVQDDWEASFRRGTALNKITLKNFASSVEINKVKITAEGKKLAGGRHFNLTTGEGLEVYGTDATIEVLYATPLSGTSMDVWFTSWNAELTEGDKLTVVAYTTDNKTYTKEITLASGKTIKFLEGYLNTLGAKFDGIDPVNVSSLDGNYVILAENSGNYYALKGEASGTRIASVNYTGSTSSYAGDASIIWTIATSGSGYTIKNGSNFIGWTSSNSADLVDETDYDATKCLMGIDDNGNGTYKIYVAASTDRILARNQSNAYFAFYTGSGYKDLILVPATAMEQVATPSFSPAAGEVASGDQVTISCATSGATIHYTVDGTDPTSSSAAYSSPIEITATTTIKAIAVMEGKADSEIATATYTVASAGSVTLTSSDITAGDNTVQGTNSSALAYRLGTGSNNGSLTFPAGYSTITFTLAGWATGTRSFSITNGTIAGSASLSPAAGSPSGTISAGFSTSYTGTEYTIDVTDPTQEVVFTGRRCVVWGFTAVESAPVTPTVATPTFSFIPSGNKVSISCATDGATIYYTTNGDDPTTSPNVYSEAISLFGDQMTIKAFATKSSYDDSAIASTTYYAINRDATTNGSISAVDYAAEGDEITITVTPESGYALDQLSVVYGSDNEVTVTNNKFTMPASPVTVSATFAQNVVNYDFETVAQLNALVTSTSTEYSGYLTDAVVSFAPATNTAIVKDATGSVMIYKSGHGLKQGQTYTGAINVTAIKYNGLYSEITAWDASFTGAEAAVSPESVSLADLSGAYDDYQNAYVQVAGLTVSSVDGKNIHVTDGTNNYVVYDNTSSVSVSAGEVITAVGTITKYQTTEEIKVWKAADITVTAAAPKAITFSQPSAGGSFTVNVDGNNITSGTTVASGKTVTLTATPASGYSFNGWTVSGATVANASNASTTFTMGTSAVSIAASFKEEGSNTPDPVSLNVYSNAASLSGSGATQTATWTSGDITVSAVRNATGNTQFRSSDSDHTRFYSGWTLNVESASNTIDQVEFTCTSNAYASTLAGYTFTNGSAAASSSKVTVSNVNASSTSVTLSAQVRISSIKVTYK